MPSFAILRFERHPTTLPNLAGPGEIPAFSVSVKPLALVKGAPLTLDADSPDIALGMAVRRYPHFRGVLAVQELSEYETQHPTDDSGRFFREAKTRRTSVEG